MRPLNDRIVVEITKAEEKSAGGILLPDGAQEKQSKGKVIAVGPGRLDRDGKRLSLDLKKGDMIFFGKYSGTEVKVNDVEYSILREREVLAKEAN